VSFDVEKLYSLLPALYRIRDIELSRQMGLSLSSDEEAELHDLLAQSTPLSESHGGAAQGAARSRSRAGRRS
jgi:hypothetical protein